MATTTDTLTTVVLGTFDLYLSDDFLERLTDNDPIRFSPNYRRQLSRYADFLAEFGSYDPSLLARVGAYMRQIEIELIETLQGARPAILGSQARLSLRDIGQVNFQISGVEIGSLKLINVEIHVPKNWLITVLLSAFLASGAIYHSFEAIGSYKENEAAIHAVVKSVSEGLETAIDEVSEKFDLPRPISDHRPAEPREILGTLQFGRRDDEDADETWDDD